MHWRSNNGIKLTLSDIYISFNKKQTEFKNCRLVQNPCKELIAEIVCFTHRDIDASHKDAAKACNGYDNKISAPPKKGQNVTVTGKWVIDNEGSTPHGWKEIHPVTKVTVP